MSEAWRPGKPRRLPPPNGGAAASAPAPSHNAAIDDGNIAHTTAAVTNGGNQGVNGNVNIGDGAGDNNAMDTTGNNTNVADVNGGNVNGGNGNDNIGDGAGDNNAHSGNNGGQDQVGQQLFTRSNRKYSAAFTALNGFEESMAECTKKVCWDILMETLHGGHTRTTNGTNGDVEVIQLATLDQISELESHFIKLATKDEVVTSKTFNEYKRQTPSLDFVRDLKKGMVDRAEMEKKLREYVTDKGMMQAINQLVKESTFTAYKLQQESNIQQVFAESFGKVILSSSEVRDAIYHVVGICLSTKLIDRDGKPLPKADNAARTLSLHQCMTEWLLDPKTQDVIAVALAKRTAANAAQPPAAAEVVGHWIQDQANAATLEGLIGHWMQQPANATTLEGLIGRWIQKEANAATLEDLIGRWIQKEANAATMEGLIGRWMQQPANATTLEDLIEGCVNKWAEKQESADLLVGNWLKNRHNSKILQDAIAKLPLAEKVNSMESTTTRLTDLENFVGAQDRGPNDGNIWERLVNLEKRIESRLGDGTGGDDDADITEHEDDDDDDDDDAPDTSNTGRTRNGGKRPSKVGGKKATPSVKRHKKN